MPRLTILVLSASPILLLVWVVASGQEIALIVIGLAIGVAKDCTMPGWVVAIEVREHANFRHKRA